ncbi:lipocalin family protein [Mucilaginibacter sabulilitoris]|uniref:Lipocalin family protein n=1 Tax=Mucilaginibacter sabulilitoris TaxID=1173583 RepID=A0ABZ0TR98_9SPHI|nr:lipocalin family protein [Mucilaginibacter sabulilitoris]WPU95654.1 lipocalin family protein [Mucilaginibacter sabulilitoris]
MRKEKTIIAVTAAAGLAGIAYALWPKRKVPAGTIVDPFDQERYLGIWHEVARLPSIIEKDLHDVKEEYIRNPDGTIKVITRAFNKVKNKPVEATGTMKARAARPADN